MSETSSTRARPTDGTRWDVQALRAFAVLAVVVYHLWPHRLPGGFVGVDVFFVVSGYLITGHLLRELLASGRIALARFWSRRALRLLPAAFLAIAATGVTVLLVVPSVLWGQYGRQLIASTIYLQNWQLASDAVDYLAGDDDPSPFQHFWSLSVEEQFYIALPLVLIGTVALVRILARRAVSPAVVVRVVLLVVVAASLAWSVVQTQTSPGVAYFSTATRAWEFALGGLAATLPVPTTGRRRVALLRATGTWAGVAFLVASLAVLDGGTPFPGSAALLPVLGATLVVLLGGGTALESIGRWAPVAHLGRTSYAIYLWHWPAIVLAPFVLGRDLDLTGRVVVLVGSVVVGTLSTLLVEEPFRFASRVRRWRPRRVAVTAICATVAVVALGAGTLGTLQVQQTQAQEAARRLERGDVRCFGAAAEIGSADPCVNPDLRSVRVPAPANAKRDDANRDACWSDGAGQFARCTLGPETGWTKRFIALGDSHNNALIDVYQRIAEANGWRIDVAGHPSCYFTAADQSAPSAGLLASCTTWKQRAMAYIEENHEDLTAVLVTHSATSRPVLAAGDVSAEDATVDGLVTAWRTATDAGVPVIAVRDNPVPAKGVVTCVARMTGPTTTACDQTRSAGTAPFDGQEQAAKRIGRLAQVVDLTDLYCTDTTCPAVIGGVLVYRDKTHITNTFAKTLRPFLERGIERALQRAE
ncbi:acyltransferase family protein [Curtobacterium sp. MCBD17_008]|uniref:acyltransferase family protein n=1 Tax=Curtobacterium sp. MCBD17_008 TaxID=2175656 RepID=UPI0015E8D85D|nr:acyltransferase family protein [Curtobacterium sp. MCBD17_008]